MRVLIADDEPLQRELLHLLLTQEGIDDILEASNGVQILEILAAYEIDVAFIDIQMPPMIGLECF